MCFVATLCLLSGCGKQGEGERCDRNNGGLDCENGLVCKDYTELGAGSEGDLLGAALCCPDNQAQARTTVCGGTPNLPDDMVPEETPDAGGGTPAPTTEPDAGGAPAADGG